VTATTTTDDIAVMESGETIWRGTAAEARRDPNLLAAYLGTQA